ETDPRQVVAALAGLEPVDSRARGVADKPRTLTYGPGHYGSLCARRIPGEQREPPDLPLPGAQTTRSGEEKPPSGPQHTVGLGEDGDRIVNVLHHGICVHVVEAFILEGDLFAPSWTHVDLNSRSIGELSTDLDRRHPRLDAISAEPGFRPGGRRHTLGSTNVQHRAPRLERDERSEPSTQALHECFDIRKLLKR